MWTVVLHRPQLLCRRIKRKRRRKGRRAGGSRRRAEGMGVGVLTAKI